MLADRRPRSWRVARVAAAQPAGRRRQALALRAPRCRCARRGPRAPVGLQQRVGDRRLPALGAGGEELRREHARRSGRRPGRAGRRPRRGPGGRRRWRSAGGPASPPRRRCAGRRTRRRCARPRRSSRRAGGSTTAGCTPPRRGSARRSPSTRTVSPVSALPLATLPSNTHGMAAQQRALLAGADADRLHARRVVVSEPARRASWRADGPRRTPSRDGRSRAWCRPASS